MGNIKSGILVTLDISHMTGIVIPSKNKKIISKIKKIEKLYSDEHPEFYEIAIQQLINKYRGIQLERVFSMQTGKIIRYDIEREVEVK